MPPSREDRAVLDKRLALSVLLLGLLVAGCTSDTPRREPASPTPEISATSACPKEIEIIGSDENRLPGDLEADVDGDGAPDQVSLFEGDGGLGCEAFLTVSTGRSTVSTPVADDSFSLEGGLPSLIGAAQIDGREGNEVIVRLLAGASTEFMGLFSMGGGDLHRITVQKGEFGNVFPSGGSVGHLEQSDCGDDPGSILVVTAVAQGDTYLVRRAAYNFNGGAFAPDANASGERSVPLEDLGTDAVPELSSGAPFGSCPTD